MFFFYFHYGNSGYLKNCREWQLLKEIEPFLEEESSGYLIATLDSMNINSDFLYAFDIKDKKLEHHSFLPAELETIQKDVNKYFFKYADTEFRMAFYNQQVVDKKVVDGVLKLTEAHRIKNLKENLHLATKENPLELFFGYFYDGIEFYSKLYNAEKTVFPDINLQTLKEMPYGLSDGNYVIVRHNLVHDYYLQTAGEPFKKVSKSATVYYTSADTVYDEKLCPIKDSDGKSFRLRSEYLGEDKNYIYFLGELILKKRFRGISNQYNRLFQSEHFVVQ
ncbi:hypothetical protein TH53_11430 [Pedobacter lusitanus]|uniref:Uncharacterized protein n=1 Tax=Pedobacter lusitanus TaxID=1503925 RepID=A0A0D0GLJ8_9SPHI|nr:hypothetical protein [Pedobacter lusitanus]KIO77070.1 hypothetical protein TH53_11430 [Pedobacter lusitanus]